jgi:hypothetical protein
MRLCIMIILIALLTTSWTNHTNAAATCLFGEGCTQAETTAAGGFNPVEFSLQRNPTKESTLEYLEFFSEPCQFVPLGKIRVLPVSVSSTLSILNDLQAAGIISYQQAPRENDPGESPIEASKVEFDSRLMPGIGPEHFKPRAAQCLKTFVSSNFRVTSWNEQSVPNPKAVTKVIIVEGTFDVGNYDDLFLRYLRAKKKQPMHHGKYRLLYSFDAQRNMWTAFARDYGDVSEPGFETNYVEKALGRLGVSAPR